MYTPAYTVATVTGPDRIRLFSLLTGIIVAAGAVFIAVKKKKTCGRAIADMFAPCVIFDLPRTGMIPFIAGIDAFLNPSHKYRHAHRCVADDTGELQQEESPPEFGLMTSAMSGRRHSRPDHGSRGDIKQSGEFRDFLLRD